MGRLAFYPKLEGWGRTQVNGLDLTQLSGYAKPFDVEIRDGLIVRDSTNGAEELMSDSITQT